jgi:hypothetical protein
MDRQKSIPILAGVIALGILGYNLKPFLPEPPERTVRFILLGASGGLLGMMARDLVGLRGDPLTLQKVRCSAIGLGIGAFLGAGLATNVHLHLYQTYFRGMDGLLIALVGAIGGGLARVLIRFSRSD